MKIEVETFTGPVVIDGATFDTERGTVAGRDRAGHHVLVDLRSVRRQRLLVDERGHTVGQGAFGGRSRRKAAARP